jgi:hypothetical protein
MYQRMSIIEFEYIICLLTIFLCNCHIYLSLIESESRYYSNEFNLTEEQIYLFKRIKSLEHVKNPYANLKANQSMIYASNEN